MKTLLVILQPPIISAFCYKQITIPEASTLHKTLYKLQLTASPPMGSRMTLAW
jgi:hypothetical protein